MQSCVLGVKGGCMWIFQEREDIITNIFLMVSMTLKDIRNQTK